MKEIPSYELRTETLFRHVRQYLRASGLSPEEWSEAVLDAWLKRTPKGARGNDFRESGTVFERCETNGQKIRRWMNPDISARPSMDVEESLVAALPEPYRTECRADLARRYGLLDVPLPNNVMCSDLEVVGRLTRDMGLVFNALAPVIADGKIDAKDARFVPQAINEVEKVISAAEGLRARLVSADPQRR